MIVTYLVDSCLILTILIVLAVKIHSDIKTQESKNVAVRFVMAEVAYVIMDAIFVTMLLGGYSYVGINVFRGVVFIFYIVYILMAYQWHQFIRSYINLSPDKNMRFFINGLLAVLLAGGVVSLPTGLLYEVTEQGEYLRGSLFWPFSILMSLYYLLPFIKAFYVSWHSPTLYSKEPMVFAAIPLIGIILNDYLVPLELVLPIQPWCLFLATILVYMFMMDRERKVMDAARTEREARLSALVFIHDMEQDLLVAHNDDRKVLSALGKLGKFMGSDHVRFWVLGVQNCDLRYIWKKGGRIEAQYVTDAEYHIGKLQTFFREGHEIFVGRNLLEMAEMFHAVELHDTKSIIAMPVGLGGSMDGILMVCNTDHGADQVAVLHGVAASFGGFCKNLINLQKVQAQRDTDVLTGLYNRMRYEHDIANVFKNYEEPLACVYIDVNGLHEVNNTKGHDAGDVMLQTVADGIRKNFPTDYIYRTGGDEFVLFIPGAKTPDLKLMSQRLVQELSAQGYSVAVGFSWQWKLASVCQLVQVAERKMYADKARHYANLGGAKNRGNGQVFR